MNFHTHTKCSWVKSFNKCHFCISALPFSPLQLNKKQAADNPPLKKNRIFGSALLCSILSSAALARGCEFP
ncbi:hypothetical protein SLEP1_g10933 [Rubroshorea leprosula]|uniref:Uncharacterized protein n=1 Tax=Rubroshorea leprosula TaxID=152421 RepID=A0AAV5IJJ2_9ROSI|nr:hypothetical protein SLEP1_g10933 [Rubroshorea leprosula]